ncbi:hypothetical protein BX659_11212 [Orenia metallireducens]|uniref:Uncharacterized protein n=1 Tax=Orenia metallireducens TaxID=1413210 RepID=A0A285H7K4_9FIRM|nr:hypothetical protein [Orenia metallireducens]PRX28585.1 hypothetical protein BX659_11212 [Orenia metallireducens]SNY30591.1 hypothetical protein SAMN06265827_11412 [Orenia metallireducens]
MQIRGRVRYYGMGKNEDGTRICPKCRVKIKSKYKKAAKEDGCPYCGYNYVAS